MAAFGEQYASRVKLMNAYVGRHESEQYASKITNGTAVKIKSSAPESPTYTIPTILKKLGIAPERLKLVKVDTDGFDADCIMSMGDMLKMVSPILYWENEIDTPEQAEQYHKMADYLDGWGYTHFFVFDNFGNYLCCVDKAGYKSVCNYLLRILQKCSARTFFYVDVLATCQNKADDCKNAINRYLSQFNDTTEQ